MMCIMNVSSGTTLAASDGGTILWTPNRDLKLPRKEESAAWQRRERRFNDVNKLAALGSAIEEKAWDGVSTKTFFSLDAFCTY